MFKLSSRGGAWKCNYPGCENTVDLVDFPDNKQLRDSWWNGGGLIQSHGCPDHYKNLEQWYEQYQLWFSGYTEGLEKAKQDFVSDYKKNNPRPKIGD